MNRRNFLKLLSGIPFIGAIPVIANSNYNIKAEMPKTDGIELYSNGKGTGFQMIEPGVFTEMDFDDEEYLITYDWIPAKDGQESVISNYTVTRKHSLEIVKDE